MNPLDGSLDALAFSDASKRGVPDRCGRYGCAPDGNGKVLFVLSGGGARMEVSLAPDEARKMAADLLRAVEGKTP